MAIARSQRQELDSTIAGRPQTGSMLFPDLVWAHWAWQSQVRPHSFARPGLARRLRLLLWAARSNGRPPQNGTSTALSGEALGELAVLKQQYDDEAACFQDAEGEITRSYWCASEASAVVLTERPKRLSWLPWRGGGNQRLHRATDWVTADAPEIAELLHSGDTLAIRIARVLHRVPQRIALEWIFSEQSYLLGFVERTGGHPSRREAASVVARHQTEIDRIERYYDRAAKQAARIRYFEGMLLGLIVVAFLAPLLAGVIELFGDLNLSTDATRNFYACFGAGAVGAVVSVMTRMRQEDGIKIDYEVGRGLVVMLGAFRPVLGAIFGTATFFALESGVFQPTPDADATAFFYYPLFAFAAGFSERYAHVIMGDADLSVARALTGAETSDESVSDGRPSETVSAGGPAAPSGAPAHRAEAAHDGRRS